MRIAVIGAGGFVGRSLTRRLAEQGHEVLPVLRTPAGIPDERIIDDLLTADWPEILTGVEAVVHLAARVHMMNDTLADPLAEYRRVNTQGARHVAEAAAACGVRRFVFLSTIKVNGEATEPGKPFLPTDVPQASDPYGISKQEAEAALFELGRATGLEITVIRPPLIYGPGVKGNLQSLMQAIERGIPLPLGGITRNRRSLLGIDNLISLISVALSHPRAANRVLLAADGEAVSTTGLLQLIAKAMGKSARTIPVPAPIIRLLAAAIGKKAAAARLVGSLEVDISDTRQRLDWTPPVSLEEGMRSAAKRC